MSCKPTISHHEATGSNTTRSASRRAALRLLAACACLLSSTAALADEPVVRADASVGFLGLSGFRGEEARPIALTYGAAAAGFFSAWLGAGVAVSLSQPDSYPFPCEAGLFGLRRFQRFGGFAGGRWVRQEVPVAWEPWGRFGACAVQAARRPPGSVKRGYGMGLRAGLAVGDRGHERATP